MAPRRDNEAEENKPFKKRKPPFESLNAFYSPFPLERPPLPLPSWLLMTVWVLLEKEKQLYQFGQQVPGI